MIQFQARNPSAVGKHGGLSQLTQLASVDKGLQDVLLDCEIIVADAGQLISQWRQVFDSLPDPIISHVIGRKLGTQAQVIADILFEKSFSVVATDHWVGKINVFNDGLQLSFVVFLTLRPKITVIFLGWPMVRLASSSLWPS